MARLMLISVAMVAFIVFANAQQQPPMRNVMRALEEYYRARLRQDQTDREGAVREGTGREGTGREGTGRDTTGGRVESGRPHEWDWEWEQTGEREGQPETGVEETRTSPIDRLTTMVEDLQIRLFMDEIRQSSQGYEHVCPKLMDLLERGFMKQWLVSYMQRTQGEAETRPEREGEWTTEFSRLLRRRPSEGREGRTERTGTWREEEFVEEERTPTANENSPMWQGLMASCYVYQDLVHGNAPRLDAANWARATQQ